MVAKMQPEEMIRPPQGTPEDAIVLLRSWDEEDAQGDDEGEPWEEVLRSIDANRSSYRRLFPDLDNK